MTPPTDPGVTVAPGDPGRISAASIWHSDLADGLDAHAGTISGAAASLAGSWDGQAAHSYQQLSTIVSGHFRTAAGQARGAAATLRRYAQALERCQREGIQALHQAEHWLSEVQRDAITLGHAQDAVRQAQDAVARARSAMTTAASVPTPGGAIAAAGRALSAAEGELIRAQTAERDARRALEQAQHELARAQLLGRRAWHEAQAAAEQATGSLAPLTVAPPPLAGAPADPFGPLSPFVSSGSAAGGLPWEISVALTAAGYGTSLIGGASQGVSGLASWAGRTLRSGATAAERSAASPVLRSAGSLGRDLAPIARAAGPVGAVASLASGLAGGDSPRRAVLQTVGSTVGGTVAGGAVGGACEAGTVGLGTPACVVLGAGAAAAGSYLGGVIAGGVDDLLP